MSSRTELTYLTDAAGTIQSFLVSCDDIGQDYEFVGMASLKAMALDELNKINNRIDLLVQELKVS